MARLTRALWAAPVTFALLLATVTACTPGAPAKHSLRATNSPTAETPALWSRSVTGGITNARIYRGAVIFGVYRGPAGETKTLAFDVGTGRQLWERSGVLPLSGASSYLVAGKSVERIDASTGRVIWRSAPLCGKTHTSASNADFKPPAPALPTYAAVIGRSLYVGCNGGKLFALQLSSGHVFASAYPAPLDNYDQIVALGHGALGVGGTASGAYMYRQSALVKSDTLSTIVAFKPDNRIIGTRDGNAILAATCCQGVHSDSWPANIEFASLATGEVLASVSLHPYRNPLPPDEDLPGPGVVLAAGDILYVATHSAFFAYDLKRLETRPRVLSRNLTDLPVVIDGRYLSMQEGAPGSARRTVILDAYHDNRPIWSGYAYQALPIIFDGRARPVAADASCRIGAASAHYAFMACSDTDIASRAHLGAPPTAIKYGQSTLLPESIAVYAFAKE